jgi:hypothetical protein
VRFAPIPDPETDAWLCPCTVLYPDQLGAVKCARRHQRGAARPAIAPVIPGDTLMKSRPVAGPAQPWTPTTYVSAAANPSYRVFRRIRRIGAWIAVLAAVYLLGLVVFGAIADDVTPAPRPGAVTPSPTLQPCASGGVKCYWGPR